MGIDARAMESAERERIINELRDFVFREVAEGDQDEPVDAAAVDRMVSALLWTAVTLVTTTLSLGDAHAAIFDRLHERFVAEISNALAAKN